MKLSPSHAALPPKLNVIKFGVKTDGLAPVKRAIAGDSFHSFAADSADVTNFFYGRDGRAYSSSRDDSWDLVAEVLTLQPGRYYRTRDGRKAYVASVGNPFDADYDCPAAGFICGDDVGCEWPLDGGGESETEIDLVEEWRDPPKTKTQTIALYEANGTICMLNYDSKEQARDIIEGPCGYKLLAVKEVTLTEGDGM